MITSRQRKKEIVLSDKIVLNKNNIKRSTRQYERRALQHANKFIFKRANNLANVQFRVIIWSILMSILILTCMLQTGFYNEQYITKTGVDGGTYSEGIVGSISSVNPVYATTDDERAISGLLYDGLFGYDSANKLHGELATTYSRSDNGLKYVINLRENVYWTDGEPITADDVIYTFDLLQDAELQSSYKNTFQAVELRKLSDTQIEFDLPIAQFTFPQLLTFGILPKHQYVNVKNSDFREFYTANVKITSGKYILNNITRDSNNDKETLYFVVNDKYYGKTARIHNLQIHTYSDVDSLRVAMDNNFISETTGLGLSDAESLLNNKKNYKVEQIQTTDSVFALFNMRSPIFADRSVREIISEAVDTEEIRRGLALDNVAPAAVLGYSENENANIEAARTKLDENGWILDKTGVRTRDGQKMQFELAVISGSSYESVAEIIAIQLAKVGILVNVNKIDSKIINNTITNRAYDMILYQLRLDENSDGYIYWHSSQISQNGLNMANCSSPIIDSAISAMRLAMNENEYANAKARFFSEWKELIPAIPIYTTNIYFIHDRQANILDNPIANLGFRYNSISDWTVLQQKFNVTP